MFCSCGLHVMIGEPMLSMWLQNATVTRAG